MNFLIIFEFFNIKNIKILGIKNILIFDLEYLTRLSVNNEIDNISVNLDNE